jgi:hypothetical protein
MEVFIIKLLELCSCNWLTVNFNPICTKNIFTDLDELIIIWCKFSDVSKDSCINMIWKNPKRQNVITIPVKINKSTTEEPVRRAWTVMETKAANILNNCYGNWNVEISEDDNILGEINFDFRNIKSKTLSTNSNSIMMNITI